MKELINHRRQKAKESFEAEKVLYENGNLFSDVNRLYYAVFYQVTALLLTKGLGSSKHSGVMSLFNKEFVKTGIISKKAGKFYGRIFELRQEGDYADFTEFKKNDVALLLRQANMFIKELDKKLN